MNAEIIVVENTVEYIIFSESSRNTSRVRDIQLHWYSNIGRQAYIIIMLTVGHVALVAAAASGKCRDVCKPCTGGSPNLSRDCSMDAVDEDDSRR